MANNTFTNTLNSEEHQLSIDDWLQLIEITVAGVIAIRRVLAGMYDQYGLILFRNHQ